MKTIKNFTAKTKITALILAILIIFYLVPVSVFAEGISTDTGGEVSPPETSSATDSYTHHGDVYEVTELREESVKHFRLEDGSYLAASYNDAVHYMGENGEWQDIDNRLLSIGTDYSTSNARIKFAKKITGSGKLFSLEEGNTKLSMSVIGANKGIDGFVTNYYDSEEDSLLQKKMNLENLTSTILYEEVFDGVDIEYVAHSLNVKENIVVKEKSEKYSYSFELKVKNLTPTLSEDGSISFSDDEGNVKYTIPAPVVYDSGMKYADKESAKYTLEGKNGKYTITVSVDPSWMNAESTLFPVTVDPTIVTTSHGVINQNIPSLMCVQTEIPLVFSISDIPALPTGAIMSSATLSLAYKGSGGFFVPRLTLSDTLTEEIYDIDRRSGYNMYIWDVTELITQWYENSWTSRSLTVSIDYPEDTNNLNVPIWLMPASSDFLNINTPVFSLNYAISKGIEDYYSYSSHALENAGNGSVNLATGNLTFISDLTSTTDYLLPMTISAVYNSDLANKKFNSINANDSFSQSYMPYGYKLNIQETFMIACFVRT